MAAGSVARGDLPFTEKSFYLNEFRGRTLAIAARPGPLGAAAAIEPVLSELQGNGTASVLLSSDPVGLAKLSGAPPLRADLPGLEGRVWRSLQPNLRAGILVPEDGLFGAAHEVVGSLGISKLVWLDGQGGLLRKDGRRLSFVDLDDFAQLAPDPGRADLLLEIERALRAGLPAINLCTAEGLADELFTYAGSGTLFTRKGYVDVRRLTIDDFGAAHALVARGEAEGYLFPRSDEDQDAVLAQAFGAFVEGHHLAGIGALLRHGDVGEIASLYTLTRFLGEGIGGHLVAALCEEAKRRGDVFVFACTTTERVVGFFERSGFEQVRADALPDEKWRDYDPERRRRVTCLGLSLKR
jgi:N-acetylglutamate synthase-like GNAT family acetyltransferase